MANFEPYLNALCLLGLGIVFFVKLIMLGHEKAWSTDSIIHHVFLALLSGVFVVLTRAILKEFAVEPPTWFSPVIAAMGESILRQKLERNELQDMAELEEENELTSSDKAAPKRGRVGHSPRKGAKFSEGGRKNAPSLHQRKVVRSEEFPAAEKPKLLVSKSLPNETTRDVAGNVPGGQGEAMTEQSHSSSAGASTESGVATKRLDPLETDKKQPSHTPQESGKPIGASRSTESPGDGRSQGTPGEKEKKGKKKKLRPVSALETVNRHKNTGYSQPSSSPTSPVSLDSPVMSLSPRYYSASQNKQPQSQKEFQKRKDNLLSSPDKLRPMNSSRASKSTQLFPSPWSKPNPAIKLVPEQDTSGQARPTGGEHLSKGPKVEVNRKERELAAALAASSSAPARAWQTGEKTIIPGDMPVSPTLSAGTSSKPRHNLLAGSDLSKGILDDHPQPPLIDLGRISAELYYASTASPLYKPPSFIDMTLEPPVLTLSSVNHQPLQGVPTPLLDPSEAGLLGSPVSNSAFTPFDANALHLDGRILGNMQENLQTSLASNLHNLPEGSSHGLLSLSRLPAMPVQSQKKGDLSPSNVQLDSSSFPGFSVPPELSFAMPSEPWSQEMEGVSSQGALYALPNVETSFVNAEDVIGSAALGLEPSKPAVFSSCQGLMTVDTNSEVPSLTQEKESTKTYRSFWSNDDPQEAFLASSSEKYFDDVDLL